MKKGFRVGMFFVFLLPLVSCSKGGSNDSKLPGSVGENVFAGKTYASEARIFKFVDDSKVEISTRNWESMEYEKDSVAEYSFDSEKNRIYFRNSGVYYNDKLFESVEDFVKEAMVNYKDQVSSMMEDETLSIDEKSKANYEMVVRKSYSSQGSDILGNIIEYSYSDYGEGMDMSIIPDSTVRGKDFDGVDDENVYAVNLFGNEIVIVKQQEDIENQVVYYAFGNWNKNCTSYKGNLYSVNINAESTGESYKQTLVCREEGKISLTFSLTSEENEGYMFYSGRMNFKKIPACLKDLKSASLSGVFASEQLSESYSLVTGDNAQ